MSPGQSYYSGSKLRSRAARNQEEANHRESVKEAHLRTPEPKERGRHSSVQRPPRKETRKGRKSDSGILKARRPACTLRASEAGVLQACPAHLQLLLCSCFWLSRSTVTCNMENKHLDKD